MQKNKRKFVRVGLQSVSTCTLLDPSGVGSRTVEVTITDLSAGGIALVAAEPFAVGQPVRVTLRQSDPEIDVAVIGMVVRAENRTADGSYRFAVRFSSLGDPERVALTRFVLRSARSTGQGAELIVPAASTHG